MYPKIICLLVLVLGLAGIPGAIGTAEDTTEANTHSTPADDAELQGDELPAWKELEGKQLEDGSPAAETVQSEVADMMLDPYRPYAVDSEDDKEVTVDSDIVAVNDSHVVKLNASKTHDSDVMSPPGQHDSVAESVSSATASPDPAGLPSVPGGSQEQAGSTDASVDQPSATYSGAEPEGSPAQTSPPEAVTEKHNALISTGLSSVSIASVSRSAMSPPTEVAAILSIVLVVSAVAGYLGMLAWRRILEKRYGNREMLVNEDDDLRHFEL